MESAQVSTKKRLIIFIVITFIIAWTFFLMLRFLDIPYGQMNSIIYLIAAMFAPTLGNILTRLITKEGFKNMYLRPNFKGHVKAYLLIFFMPSILLFISGAVYFLIMPNMLDRDLTAINQLVSMKGGGISVQTIIIALVLQIVFAGPIINLIPTLGEELGWRGYLLPKLQEYFSDKKAVIITGVIWGLWHAPIIAMGHNYGTDYWAYPWTGILGMVIFCVVLGIIEGYFTIKLKSAIPAAMIHSTVNAGAGLPVYFAKSGYNTLLGPAITGIIGIIPFLILAIILFIQIGKKENISDEPH